MAFIDHYTLSFCLELFPTAGEPPEKPAAVLSVGKIQKVTTEL